MPEEDKKMVPIDTSGPDAEIDIEETKDESVVETETPEQETDKTYEEGIEREGQIIKRKGGGSTSGGEKVLIESWRELF